MGVGLFCFPCRRRFNSYPIGYCNYCYYSEAHTGGETMTSTSNQFSITWIDIKKGFVVGVFSPVFTVLIESLKLKALTFDWANIANVALYSALGYILKNWLTPARIVITEKDVVVAVKEGEATIKVVPLAEEGQMNSSNETFQSER